jgi:hypothetical protein
MKALTEKELLPELKRRIKGALTNIKESKIKSDWTVLNTTHTIHFEINSGNYLIKGTATKRIYNKDGTEILY